MHQVNRKNHLKRELASPLVIPLLAVESGISVFEETSEAPVSFQSKAQFFIDRKLYQRALMILELMDDLGERDVSMRLTLASLQILYGQLDRARQILESLKNEGRESLESFLCYAEMERHRVGTEHAIAYLKSTPFGEEPKILERIRVLQVAEIK